MGLGTRLGIAAATFGMSEAGGLRPLYELLNRRRGGGGGIVDISAELARIDALISQAREQARKAIDVEAGISRKRLAGDLATRGVYQSPAAAIPLEALEGERVAAIGRSEAGLLSQGANLRAGALGQLTNLRVQADQEERERSARNRAGLLSAGTALATSIFFRNPAPLLAALPGQGGDQAAVPYYLSRPGSQYDIMSSSPYFRAGMTSANQLPWDRGPSMFFR